MHHRVRDFVLLSKPVNHPSFGGRPAHNSLAKKLRKNFEFIFEHEVR